mgnify:CR=1 FL=1
MFSRMYSSREDVSSQGNQVTGILQQQDGSEEVEDAGNTGTELRDQGTSGNNLHKPNYIQGQGLLGEKYLEYP